jgi:hypothetical protein
MGWFCLFETVVPTNLLEAHALFDRTTCTGIKGRRRSEDDGGEKKLVPLKKSETNGIMTN